MGKLIALGVAGAGVAAVSVGGVYIVRGSGVGKSTSDPVAPGRELLFDSVEKFENGWKNSKCVKDLFEGGFDDDDKRASAPELKSGSAPTDGTFFDAAQDNGDPYRSCVIIDWKREDYSNGKWKGKFT